jgi:hypothetical protein
MLEQAYAEKKLLETVTGLDVQPLLVFSQAWLVERARELHERLALAVWPRPS